MDTTRIDLKIFADPAAEVEPRELIPVFHRWIQQSRLDELLIDVADYAHVHHGPGVLLIAHDAQYAYDHGEGRPGLLYSRRRVTGPAVTDVAGAGGRLRSIFAAALTACRALETEESLEGRLTFRGDELMLRLNDRLAGRDRKSAEAELRAALEPLLAELYPDDGVRVERVDEDPRERMRLAVRAADGAEVATLLERLGEGGER